jgi:hypothetical protein
LDHSHGNWSKNAVLSALAAHLVVVGSLAVVVALEVISAHVRVDIRGHEEPIVITIRKLQAAIFV